MQDPSAPVSEKKLYTKGWLSFATYLGGPLAAGYLLSKNFKQLGDHEMADNAFRIGLFSTLLLFGSILFIPEAIMEKLPGSLIPAIYTAITYAVVMQYQEKRIQAHLAEGGAKISGWKASGVGLLCLLITLLYAFGIALLLIFTLPESLLVTF